MTTKGTRISTRAPAAYNRVSRLGVTAFVTAAPSFLKKSPLAFAAFPDRLFAVLVLISWIAWLRANLRPCSLMICAFGVAAAEVSRGSAVWHCPVDQMGLGCAAVLVVC